MKTQYFARILRSVCRAKNVRVKSMRSGMTVFFASAQKDVNSKELEVFCFLFSLATFQRVVLE